MIYFLFQIVNIYFHLQLLQKTNHKNYIDIMKTTYFRRLSRSRGTVNRECGNRNGANAELEKKEAPNRSWQPWMY